MFLKYSLINCSHSSSIIPLKTLVLKLLYCIKFNAPPKAPYFCIICAKINIFIPEFKIAQAHIGHGSKVTYKSQSVKRQFLSLSAASFRARISAWAETCCNFFLFIMRCSQYFTISYNKSAYRDIGTGFFSKLYTFLHIKFVFIILFYEKDYPLPQPYHC